MFGSLRLVIVLLLPMLVGACALPVVYGPHYRVIYPDADRADKPSLADATRPIMAPFQSPEAIKRSFESRKPEMREAWTFGPAGTRLRLARGRCMMWLKAAGDDENFMLDWRIDRYSGCDLSVASDPVLVEDMETGKRYEVRAFLRLFQNNPPGLSIHETVDLASSIRGFKEIPAAERRYTVSLPFRKEFNGKLPDRLTIQLPPLWVGARKVQIPPLVLHRRSELLGPFSYYEPGVSKKMSSTFAVGEFGGSAVEGGLSEASFERYREVKKLWYEQDGEIFLASSFIGREDMKKWGGYYSSLIRGSIDIHVRSGLPIRLEDGHVIWQQAPGDEKPVLMPVKRYSLIKYTTARYDDALSGRFLGFDPAERYRGEGVPYDAPDSDAKPIEPYVDKDTHLVVMIPGYQPKRVRVTLPKITVDGEVWPIHPIEFEYQKSAAELIDAM